MIKIALLPTSLGRDALHLPTINIDELYGCFQFHIIEMSNFYHRIFLSQF
jgi:hypothetical protein